MPTLAGHLRAHPRLLLALAIGTVAGTVFARGSAPVVRALVGWNAGVWSYLAAVAVMMWRADGGHVKQMAVRLAESVQAVLLVVTIGAIVSLGAVVLELAAVKGGARAWTHVAF